MNVWLNLQLFPCRHLPLKSLSHIFVRFCEALPPLASDRPFLPLLPPGPAVIRPLPELDWPSPLELDWPLVPEPEPALEVDEFEPQLDRPPPLELVWPLLPEPEPEPEVDESEP